MFGVFCGVVAGSYFLWVLLADMYKLVYIVILDIEGNSVIFLIGDWCWCSFSYFKQEDCIFMCLYANILKVLVNLCLGIDTQECDIGGSFRLAKTVYLCPFFRGFCYSSDCCYYALIVVFVFVYYVVVVGFCICLACNW